VDDLGAHEARCSRDEGAHCCIARRVSERGKSWERRRRGAGGRRLG
jgi:hypothetical protein